MKPDLERLAFDQYLERLPQDSESEISVLHVAHLRRVWELILSHFSPDFDLPVACPTQDGALQLSWTANGKHTSIDVYANGEGDWFFHDRETLLFTGGSLVQGGSLPKDFLRLLALCKRKS